MRTESSSPVGVDAAFGDGENSVYVAGADRRIFTLNDGLFADVTETVIRSGRCASVADAAELRNGWRNVAVVVVAADAVDRGGRTDGRSTFMHADRRWYFESQSVEYRYHIVIRRRRSSNGTIDDNGSTPRGIYYGAGDGGGGGGCDSDDADVIVHAAYGKSSENFVAFASAMADRQSGAEDRPGDEASYGGRGTGRRSPVEYLGAT